MRRSRVRLLAWLPLALAPAMPLPAHTEASPGTLLEQAASMRHHDHPGFVRLLSRLHAAHATLTTPQIWQLRYLDAWEAMFTGDYPRAEPALQAIIAQSGDPALVTRAEALRLGILSISQRYGEAYELANRLADGLDGMRDPQARFEVLNQLSQAMNYAGQYAAAAQYARMMAAAIPPGESACKPAYLLMSALVANRQLRADAPELREADQACARTGEVTYHNGIALARATLLLREKRGAEALALLERFAPAIDTSAFYPHQLDMLALRAEASALERDDDAAMQAVAAIAHLARPGDTNIWLRDAFQVAYRIEKARGHAEAALDWQERYVAQERGASQDLSTRALAYEIARQHNLTQQFETERLSQQNAMLRMRQALDAKAVENARLYVALLSLALLSLLLWALRLRRSQQRFKRLSRHDGLTGIFNRQHFTGEAQAQLQALERRGRPACLVTFDLDHFKRINDTHGHVIGDRVLQAAVASCRACLRPGDLFGRLGGEEFGVLLTDCARESGLAIADRIRLAIATTPADATDRAVSVSASIGLASTAAVGYQLDELYAAADVALYRAKRSGRNRVNSSRETARAEPAG